MIGYYFIGVSDPAHLDVLLEAPCQKIGLFRSPSSLQAVVGWGLKAKKTLRYAHKHGLPYISVEDGFLRSFGLGVQGARLHSLVVDYSGIYYDATAPCDLESMIRECRLSASAHGRAVNAMALLRHYRLSKYNQGLDFWGEAALLTGKKAVLVVDQTAGDASIGYGLATADTFRQMLADAIADNPGAEVLVKVHPDVIAGKKQGHLLELAQANGCRLIGEDISPWALLDTVQTVYVVTSQMGFEALIAGKQVHCYGQPFYAGWGLTQDQLTCERRGVQKALEEVFTAAYLQYCRYINPYTGTRCEFEDTAFLLAEQKQAQPFVSGPWAALGFAGSEKPFVPAFLRSKHKKGDTCQLTSSPSLKADQTVLAWASSVTPELVAQCEEEGAQLWRVEQGFLHLLGLEQKRSSVLSLVMDVRGMYYDASGPSDLEYLLQNEAISSDLVARAKRLRQRLVELMTSNANLGQEGILSLPQDRTVVLVPGQIEGDAGIQYGAPYLKTGDELLTAVRVARPDAFIVYVPHPDTPSDDNRKAAETVQMYDLEVRDIALKILLGQVDEIHTLTSFAGFEGLLRDIPVTTYGLPFYAGWGLTEDKCRCERRGRKRSLDELVAATLILYPQYVDLETQDRINVETAVDLLSCQQEGQRGAGLAERFMRMFARFT